MGGAAGTSNVLAGMAYRIPLSGTMAHSYVMRFADEAEAYRTFARVFPQRTTLLIDTYDTEEGARIVARVATELRTEGIGIRAVRIDSGDIAAPVALGTAHPRRGGTRRHRDIRFGRPR